MTTTVHKRTYRIKEREWEIQDGIELNTESFEPKGMYDNL